MEEQLGISWKDRSDTRVCEPQIRARLGTTAHKTRVSLSLRLKELLGPVTRVKKKKKKDKMVAVGTCGEHRLGR